MVTIKDIAREAGVSQGTVSNVINKTGKVSAEKIKLVEDTIVRLGYIPNVQASLLRQGGSHTVAVIIPTLKESTYLDFYCTIRRVIEAYGYEVLIYTSDDTDTMEEVILEKVRIANILAVVTVSTLSEKCLEIYSNLPYPVIYIERKPAQIRSVDVFYGFHIDTLKADWEAVFSGCAWKHVAIFTSPYHFLISPDFRDFLNALACERKISLSYYTSDINYALSTAFDIVQAQPEYDAIITAGTIRSSNINTVFSICRTKRRPKLLSIDSTSTCSIGNFLIYEMDFCELGSTIAKELVAYSSQKTKLHGNNTLKPKGFSYQFPEIKKEMPDSISLLTLDNPSTNALRKLLPMFEAISGIKVNLVCMSYVELHSQLNSLKTSCPYDLIRMDVADFQPLGKELYMPLSDILDISTVSRELCGGRYQQYSVIDEIPYAFPFDPSVQLFFYRKDLFHNALICRAYYEEYREPLTTPATLEQYIRIAKFFSQSVHPESPTQFGATTTYGSDAACASDFLPHYLGFENHSSDMELFPINSPRMVEAMRQYKELQKYTCKQEWWRDSLYQFTTGKAATTIIYSNYAPDIINPKFSNVIGQVGAAVIPGGHPLLGGGVIGVSRFSKKIQPCRQFFTWYYSADIAATLIRLGAASPLSDICGDFSNTAIYPWGAAAKDSSLLGTRGSNAVCDPKYTIRNYEFAIGTAVQKLILDDIPPEHAAIVAQTLYDYR